MHREIVATNHKQR